jgi:L-threonylcarbamoyladenylate synthase
VVIGVEEIVGAGFLALSDIETPLGMVRLASPKTPEDFARILYSTLRLADEKGLRCLVVFPPNGKGLALAINERLQKASQGR